jgi:hypothetical protein
MFDKLKNLFKKEPAPADRGLLKPKKTPKTPKVEAPKQPELSAKDKATQAGEPYVNVIGMELDPNNLGEGAFELDWNDLFIARLVKAGYMKKKDDTDRDIIDRWFADLCRGILTEVYEQVQADPSNRDLRSMQTKDIGNGRTEVS